ncbi:MAG: hypothetical protein ABSB40_02085 [Nitrososphaeria archaeon]
MVKQLSQSTFNVTVTGVCTGPNIALQYFDLSYYVNNTLGVGVYWYNMTASGAKGPPQGLPPAINVPTSYSWIWTPPKAGTYVIEGRLYMRNTAESDVELWSSAITVSTSTSSSSTTSATSISGFVKVLAPILTGVILSSPTIFAYEIGTAINIPCSYCLRWARRKRYCEIN